MGYTGTPIEVEVLDIVVNDSKTSTWTSFINEYLIYFENKDSKIRNPDALFAFEENNVRIYEQYTDEEKERFKGGASKDLLKFGTLIKVPKDNLMREILPNTGNLAIDLNKIKLYMPPNILEAFQDRGYAPLRQIGNKKDAGSTFLGNAYRVNNNVTVWCFCKALGKDGESGRMINLTPFLDNVTTNVSETGGNFTLSIAPITCEYDANDGWVVSKNTYSDYAYNGKISTLFRDSSLYQKDGEFKQKKFFFHHLIQPNDLIFIQFETLANEEKVREIDPQLISSLSNFYPKQSPAGRFWDMICLVDNAQKKYSPESTVVDVEISGRDFMKLLIDDGCYIYPLDYARGLDPNKGQAIQRVLASELYFFKSFVDVSVGYLVNFVMNLLSNISIIKDDQLFAGWGDQRSYRFDLISDNIQKLSEESRLQNKESLAAGKQPANRGEIEVDDKIVKRWASGIWQIVKLSIDEDVSTLRLVDTSITDYQGSLLNYINKVCQKPFCEFFGDTYGDQYHFVVRKPPFTQSAFLECFDKMGSIIISEDNIIDEDLCFDDSEVYSWYRIRPSGSFIDKNTGDYIASELTLWLEEFAELYGAKSLDITTIYGQIYNTDSSQSKMDELIVQFRKDLIYLVETTIYLPFTRKGTITLCPGDRRIKRGMVIRHSGTSELFYVDAVSNTAAIGDSAVDRRTVLTVSRGMVEQYARNKVTPRTGIYDFNDNVLSYFNLVDFGLDMSKNTKITPAGNIKIRKPVLDFFLKRKQFMDTYTAGEKDFTIK